MTSDPPLDFNAQMNELKDIMLGINELKANINRTQHSFKSPTEKNYNDTDTIHYDHKQKLHDTDNDMKNKRQEGMLYMTTIMIELK